MDKETPIIWSSFGKIKEGNQWVRLFNDLGLSILLELVSRRPSCF